MDKHDDHSELIEGFMAEQREVLDTSEQAMYVFLDDNSRACNDKFAQLLGYSSAGEWRKVNTNGEFPATFVDENSQEELVSNYQAAMESKVASRFKVTWKKKQSGTVESTVILIPIVYKGHLFALHFVS